MGIWGAGNMKDVLCLLLIVCICMPFTGCEREPDGPPVVDAVGPSANTNASPPEPDEPPVVNVVRPSGRANAPPIVIGMTKTEVAEFYPFIGGEFDLMTTPSQFRPARNIISRDNVRFKLAFDENDRVCAIHTIDKTFRLPNGIGVGSTYAEIKQLGNYFVAFRIIGYVRMVKLEEGTLFGFPWKSREETDISDDEKVDWMELDKIP